MNMAAGDLIAQAVLKEFDSLPANRKPVVRGNGLREWVPLSGIVAEFEGGEYVCVALATGMKCLPTSKLALSKGVGIHDWHAEVLALRAFNRFVLQECRDVLLRGDASSYLQHRQKREALAQSRKADGLEPRDVEETQHIWHKQPFEWRPDVALHMYCSEAPCGDASMELTMAAQDDASPWTAPTATEAAATAAGSEDVPTSEPLLSGRGYFSRLGTVRRKPGRGDAPPTLSKSCSDKMALRQCTSILGGLATPFVSPDSCYLKSVVLPATQYSETGCRRCFSADVDADIGSDLGRMAPVAGRKWPGGYAYMPLNVQTTDLEFSFSKRSVRSAGASSASSNLSVAWTQNGINECLVNGVMRGRKAFDPAGASMVSRRQMWRLARQVASEVEVEGDEELKKVFNSETYARLKRSSLFAARERVKEDVKMLALRGWLANEGDEDWGLDTLCVSL
ncbi:trna-specific adenosine deaminase [Ophiostoma piceae UAMH 11346]|uniref:Trna-specific adenosine deaminase n=1 Tax=Ophiostoma piceae (strain UAMH 11346) TaxID=1262450 RepID=S3BTS2_OPHP1|nr:trna-specific adenosine deaminase [Ophiostoma piceae UAMH 11346]